MKISSKPHFKVRLVPGKNSRAFWATEITVSVANTVISRVTLGGRFTPEQAAREFKVNRKRFTVEPGAEGLFYLAAA